MAIWRIGIRHMARQATLEQQRPAHAAAPEIESYMEAVRRSQGPNAYVVLLGLRSFDTPTLHKKIEQGFAFSALLKILRLMALPMQVLADLLFIPPRTLQRRKASGRLEPDESDRLLRLSRVYGKAIELFEGNNHAALEWLQSPLTALAGASPLSLTKTEPGAHEVERLINRLEYGVFS
jgi:putative toxin-antitoxin system antitoxin component (TIGR02293 family)